MATLITKNSSTASSVPTNAQLVQGELAVNVTDKRLYTENASGTVVELGTNPGSAVTHTAGTAGAPAITTTGDTNTGIFFPAADTVAASVGGTEGLRLTSTGLGVLGGSVTSPAAKIHAVGSVRSSNGAGTIYTQLSSDGVYSTGTDLYLLAPTGYSNIFYTNNTERMRLDSSGNLGLGVTPSAWSLGKAIEVGTVGNSIWGIGSSNMVVGSNIYYASSSYKYANTAAASAYQQAGGVHYWYNAASGTAGNTISFTQAMTLNSSGNLGVGTTTINYRVVADCAGSSSNDNGISVYNDNNSAYGGSYNFEHKVTSGGSVVRAAYISSEGGGGTSFLRFATTNASTLAERIRITSGGDLLVGRTSAGLTTAGAGVIKNAGGAYLEVVQGTNGVACMYLNQSNGSGTQTVADFRYNNTQVGTINVTSTACTYNNLSDYRLKTVIGSVSGAGARIDALEPVEYEWKVNGARTRGFLAHKFQEVYPQSVAGEKDAVDAKGKPVYQSMQASTSEVIADLVAEIQSLRARVAALESNP